MHYDFGDWELFLSLGGIGLVFLLVLAGFLVLILPGRLDPAGAKAVGLGRQVEALLLVSLMATLLFAGMGQVPVYIDEDGMLGFSMVGALVPTVLSIHFLWRAGLPRGFFATAGVAACSVASYVVSYPIEGLGIAAEFPDFFLPAIVAAAAATTIAPRRLSALPIAYACGSLGALIGADLVRIGWVFSKARSLGASFGGAEALDMVFMAGLWGAAFAAIPLAGYFGGLRRSVPLWERLARTSAEGQPERAVREAVQEVNRALQAWATAHGRAEEPLAVLRRDSYAEPVLARAEALLALPVQRSSAKKVLEELEHVHRRLTRPRLPAPASSARRFAAGLIDVLVVGAIMVAASVLVAPIEFNPVADETPVDTEFREAVLKTVFVLWIGVASHILYPFLSEWATGGATLGKFALGLRVRRLDGSAPTAWDLLTRNLARVLDLPLFYLVTFAASKETGRQRLGDYFAETVVVRMTGSKSSTDTTSPIPSPTAAKTWMRDTARAPR